MSLLRSHSTSPFASRCLQAIETSEFKYSPETVLPIDRVLHIYSVRARINSEINRGIILGFEELIASLSEAPENCAVKLQSVELISKWFTIFTDEDASVLFGILESPKKKAAWFDPVKGYDS